MPALVVVSGPPGAGKTTIAEALAARLNLPLLAKDTIKETLADTFGVADDREASQRLGGTTFALLFQLLDELLGHGVSVIAEGNFGRAEEFLALPPARILQAHVTAPPDVLRARLAARTARHRVHYDVEATDEIAARAAGGEWAPLPIGGELLTVETSPFPNLAPLVDQVAQMLGR